MKSNSVFNYVKAIVFVILIVSFISCAPKKESADSSDSQKGTSESSEVSEYKFALILPGSIQDADFNTNGYLAAQEVKDKLNIEATYSEQVSPSDAERVVQEYIGAGYNVIGFLGGQFRNALLNLSERYMDVSFIILTGGKSEDIDKANIWNVARKWHEASYPFGVLAAHATKTGKVGYIGGMKMADFVGALNAVDDAIQNTNPEVELKYSFVGDFNDPVATRQVADQLINDGVDFIIGQVNLGFFGIIEAARASENPVLISGLYSDKVDMLSDSYTTALLINHGPVFVEVIDQIMNGTAGGYYEMKPGFGMELSEPIHNVSKEASDAALQAQQDIINGEINIEEKREETP